MDEDERRAAREAEADDPTAMEEVLSALERGAGDASTFDLAFRWALRDHWEAEVVGNARKELAKYREKLAAAKAATSQPRAVKQGRTRYSVPDPAVWLGKQVEEAERRLAHVVAGPRPDVTELATWTAAWAANFGHRKWLANVVGSEARTAEPYKEWLERVVRNVETKNLPTLDHQTVDFQWTLQSSGKRVFLRRARGNREEHQYGGVVSFVVIDGAMARLGTAVAEATHSWSYGGRPPAAHWPQLSPWEPASKGGLGRIRAWATGKSSAHRRGTVLARRTVVASWAESVLAKVPERLRKADAPNEFTEELGNMLDDACPHDLLSQHEAHLVRKRKQAHMSGPSRS